MHKVKKNDFTTFMVAIFVPESGENLRSQRERMIRTSFLIFKINAREMRNEGFNVSTVNDQ